MDAIRIPSIGVSFPFEHSRLIGNLPVLESEENELYWHLFTSVAEALVPEDLHEWMLTKTIVDCDWLNLRYERAKTKIIDLRFWEALANILERIIEDDTIVISRKEDAKGLARDWFTDEETKKTIKQHLWDYGLDENSVVVEAMRLSMEELAQLEQLVQSNERRRSFAYRDLEMWRDGKQFRRSAEAKALPSR